MKEIQKLSKAIREQRSERERLQGVESKRFEDAISADAQHAAKEAELRQCHSKEIALASIENRAANTAPIAAELQTAEQTGAQLRVAAEAAREGLRIIQERLQVIDADIEELTEKRRALLVAELDARREAAIDEYVAAVDALAPTIAKMISADRLIRKLVEPGTVRTLPGEALLARMRLERLPIPWNRTGKEPPAPRGAHGWAPGIYEAVAPYAQFEPVLASPAWLHDEPFLDAATASLADDLSSAGVDI